MSSEMERTTAAGSDDAPPDPESATTAAQQDWTAAAGGKQHEESFLVRVLLNDDHSIRSTAIRHIRTGAEGRWPGWKPEALPDFVAATCGDSAAQAEPGPSAPDEAPARDASAQAAQNLRLASSADLAIEHAVLRAAEPFTVTFALELAGEAADGNRLGYTAIVAARPLTGGPKRTVARATGLLATSAPTIRVDAEGLPPGVYRLDGAVSLREPGTDHPVGLAAAAEGLTVQVIG